MSQKIVTIERHIVEGERAHPGASGDFSGLLRDLTLAFKVIWREVSKAGLVNILGFAGKQNVHGEEVKKLDMFTTNKVMTLRNATNSIASVFHFISEVLLEMIRFLILLQLVQVRLVLGMFRLIKFWNFLY